MVGISTHAPLAGCDGYEGGFGGGKVIDIRITHPLRGATRVLPLTGQEKHDFYPRTPCGVRQFRLRRP